MLVVGRMLTLAYKGHKQQQQAALVEAVETVVAHLNLALLQASKGSKAVFLFLLHQSCFGQGDCFIPNWYTMTHNSPLFKD